MTEQVMKNEPLYEAIQDARKQLGSSWDEFFKEAINYILFLEEKETKFQECTAYLDQLDESKQDETKKEILAKFMEILS